MGSRSAPAVTVGGRLGPLAEPAFRRLFFGRLVSFAGSAVAPVALAFAVLDVTGSTTDLGLVLAASAVPQVFFLLVGGVISDRLPRHQVMVASNVISALAQGLSALLLLTGAARIWHLAALAALRGIATAFFFPASEGLVPQIVSRERLQPANALLRLALNGTNVLGTALGGVLVAATSPGWAIAFDALSFVVAAVVLASLQLPPRPVRGSASFLTELREGWTEFWSRTWLWGIVVQFSLVNAAWAGGFQLLGPVVAQRQLGGAAAWGLVLSALAAGFVAGGLLAVRWQPSRPLLVGSFGVLAMVLPLAAMALHLPTAWLAAVAFLGGVGLEQFGVAWVTVMQEQIPADRLSRVFSYDALGSFVFIPVGFAVAGPVASWLGVTATIWACAALITVATLLVLMSSDVRRMQRIGAATASVPAAS